ncbi:MAG: hypothetical protein ABW321_01745 [Polyangiales bacterium]
MSVASGTDGGGTIAVIGDLHSAWEVEDIGFFNRAAYPAVLVTGDLGRSRSQDGRRVARSLMHLLPEVLVMPGNNDVEEYPHIGAELTYRRARADLLADALLNEFDVRPHPQLARLCGYSLHPLSLGTLDVTIIAARPFSMGGPDLAFADALARNYGVRTMAESITRLKSLVDAVTTEHVVFLAHNGPTGLGGSPDDIWGRDFPPDAGDWGDPDLRVAIDYAHACGRRILAVVAGHMHWTLSTRGVTTRRWQLRDGDTLYLNAARVPRIFQQLGGAVRQHIALRLTPHGASAEERLIADSNHT